MDLNQSQLQTPPPLPQRSSKNLIIVILLAIILTGIGYFSYTSLITPRTQTQNPVVQVPTPTIELIEPDTPFTVASVGEHVVVDKKDGMYSVSVETGTQTKLSNIDELNRQSIKVTSDRKKIIYKKDDNLWISNSNGTNPVQITTKGMAVTTKYAAVFPDVVAISPSGSKILYSYSVGSAGQGGPDLPSNPSVRYGLYLLDLKTGRHTFLASDSSMREYTVLAWDNHDKVFFIANNDFSYPNYERYSLDLQSGNILPVTGAKPLPGLYFLTVGQVKYSSEMDKIVYSSGTTSDTAVDRLVPKDSSKIVAADLLGQEITDISPQGTWTTYQWADVSPDATYISYDKETGKTGKSTLFLYNIKTRETVNLGDHDGEYLWISPKEILVQKINGGDFAYNPNVLDIYKINIDTKQQELFLKNAFFDRSQY
jgi:hypothetical protein